ncbi:MAG: tRNA (adenosine(37)-N6)-dimethylallyltransferase MiaA [Candidimonas sp.]
MTPILCLTGPTAAGKSATTLALAQRWPIEIINVDSATIYRGMDIGTAKPSKAEQARVPQHLLDIRDPAESYSAAEFQRDAGALIRDIRARNRLPLLAGGTMLYLKALRDGLNSLPSADPDIRMQIDAEAREYGWPAMHQRLRQFDAATARRLAPNDSQRIQRAIEIFRLTGKPMSAYLNEERAAPASDYRYVTISLEPSERAGLHTRIAQRYQAMLEAGLLDEVGRLHARGDLHAGLPSVRCVGYRQLWDYLDGKTGLDQAVQQAIAATRQLAKRQLTWLRAQPDRHILDCLSSDASNQAIDIAAQYWK